MSLFIIYFTNCFDQEQRSAVVYTVSLYIIASSFICNQKGVIFEIFLIKMERIAIFLFYTYNKMIFSFFKKIYIFFT